MVLFCSHHIDISRDSLCSGSRNQSSMSSSSAASSSSSSPVSRTSRSHSQSSFTSLERLEIRRLIKTIKTNGMQSITVPAQLSSKITSPIQPKIDKTSSILTHKPSKSSITEELDKVFTKLRANNPNHELIYVKPSLVNKEKSFNSSLSTSGKSSDKKQCKKDDVSY